MDNGFNLKEDRITFDCMPEDMQMSDAGFNALMGCTILWGLICNFFICMFLETQVFSFVSSHPLLFILGYFALAFLGAIIISGTENAVVAFLGFNLICLPIGALLSVYVSQYTVLSISYVCLLTAIIVVIMIIVSTVFPEYFCSLGHILLVSLISIIFIVGVLVFFLGYEGHVIDYAVVALFSLYIGYDWYCSQRYAATPYNAISCATDLYLDIINIFIRLLAILGKKKD